MNVDRQPDFISALLLAAGIVFAVAAMSFSEKVVATISGSDQLSTWQFHQLAVSRDILLTIGCGLLIGAVLVAKVSAWRRLAGHRLAGNVVLVALSLCAPLLLLELVLRPLVDRQGGRLFVSDSELGWRLRPDSEDFWGGARVKTNSHGLRGPEIDYQKSDGMKRMLFLGDSVTFGYGLGSFRDVFPELVGVTLNERLESEVEAINAGVGGYSPWQELRYLQREGFRYSPDIVVVAFVLNDVTEKFGLERFGGTERPFHLSRTLPETMFGNVARITTVGYLVHQLRGRVRFGASVQQAAHREERLRVSMLFEQPERPEIRRAWDLTLSSLHGIFRECEQRRVEVLVAVVPFRFQLETVDGTALPQHATPQQRVMEFARREGVAAVDLLPVLRSAAMQEGEDPVIFFRDPSHLSAAGHRVVAASLAQKIASLGWIEP